MEQPARLSAWPLDRPAPTAHLAALRELPAHSFVIDGEAVCVDKRGHSDFHALLSAVGCRSAQLVAFRSVDHPGGIDVYRRALWQN
jgi:hypothetical protein